jgi:hypothetical protein
VGVVAVIILPIRYRITGWFVERATQQLECISRRASLRLAAVQQTGRRARHRGASYLGHRRTPPRAKLRTRWCITSDGTRPAPWCERIPISLSLEHVRWRSSECFAEFASLDHRGAFADRPSPARACANAPLPPVPHFSRSHCPSWRLRGRPFGEIGMCGVRLRTPPARSSTESA